MAAALPLQQRSTKERTMIHTRVQYDADHRVFKLVDQEFRTILEGDALYDLAIPLMFEESEVEEFLPTKTAQPLRVSERNRP